MKSKLVPLSYFLFLTIFKVLCVQENDNEKSVIFSEDDYNQKYIIKIPPQKPEINLDDVAVFVFNEYFVIWVRGAGKNIDKRFYDEEKHIFSQMRSLNVDRDYEVWENFVQPIKNGTIPNISKKKFLDNSFQVTISFPIAAIADRVLSLHKLYSNDDSLTPTKVNYRLKLPANPHYVRRTFYKNDGKTFDVFTVADENSTYIKEMKQAIATNNSDLLQNNTMQLFHNLIDVDTNYTILNVDSLGKNKEQTFLF